MTMANEREFTLKSWFPSGLETVPHLQAGSHLAHFFGSGSELRDVLVPYFKAGLENNEQCLWVTGQAFNADEARGALRAAVPDLDKRERGKQIEIVNGDQWYAAGEKPRPHDLVSSLIQREQAALGLGYVGLRTNGNCAWVARDQWADFLEYERLVHKTVRGRPMVCMCSYCVDQVKGSSHLEVLQCHDLLVPSRQEAIMPPSTAVDTFDQGSSLPLEALSGLDQIVLDALPIGVYVCNALGQIVRINRKAIELWGRVPRLLDGSERFCGSFRLYTLDHRKIAPEKTPMAQAVLYGQSFNGTEAIVENPDGKRWVARVDIAPLRNPDGRPVGAVNCFRDVTAERELRRSLEQQQSTFDLAMTASLMGTWRYTLADNVCVYDKNAQRLYGLTEARFLHDQEGVKSKFHPDDLELMWSRVAKALDPRGDGRYDVEYRVKQIDGSWRWLSAWGLVEFEGDGPDRRPIAISGASRDLTDRKQAEDLQRLLLNELNHRVKNTLATVQSIASQTLRAASDLPSAKEALDRRIRSMAQVHDLLTSRAWTGADISDIAERALDMFSQSQVEMSGPKIHVSPKHALSLSLSLHELATNAAKYGALSRSEGRVSLQWSVNDKVLHLSWVESGGPRVTQPMRKGFGSRLLEILVKDLGGELKVDYEVTGVECSISAPL